MTRFRYVVDVAEREFRTVVRTPMLAVLAVGFVGLLVGISWLGSSGAYLALVLDVLTPVEVLVPVLTFAFGYRALLGDRASGELETIRTYPVQRGRYVLGVFLGRATVVLGVVLVGLVASAALVPMRDERQLTVIASHATVDSPALYLRFVVLTAVFALTVLAIAMLVSATARSTRGGLALATGSVLLLVVGFDSALVGALTGGIVSPDGVTALLAVSPNTAYRALVFGVSLGPAGVSVPPGPAVPASTIGLVGWLVAALVVAALVVWR